MTLDGLTFQTRFIVKIYIYIYLCITFLNAVSLFFWFYTFDSFALLYKHIYKSQLDQRLHDVHLGKIIER